MEAVTVIVTQPMVPMCTWPGTQSVKWMSCETTRSAWVGPCTVCRP